MSLKGKNKQVEIDPGAGFCFGVEKAISVAEERLDKGEQVYGLGQMVHNEQEVNRLQLKGLKTVSVEDFRAIGPSKVILRAHGEPPQTYLEADRYGIELIDATCPIVRNLQKKVHKTFLEIDREKAQIVIFGKEDHPETIGLVGQTDGTAQVVSDPAQTGHLHPGKTVYLFSQTTMDPEAFLALEERLKQTFEVSGATPVFAECSICNQMKRRKPDLAKFAMGKDVIVFVSGKNSSNGRMLFEFCRSINRNTCWIAGADELRSEWFEKAEKIGVSGATSTSLRQLEEIRQAIADLIRD